MNTEARCLELDFKIGKKEKELEALEAKFKILEVEKNSIEEEIKALKRENSKLKDKFYETNDSCRTENGLGKFDEDPFVQLMVENKVLECEKENAERDVKAWKQKCMELESQLMQLNESAVSRGSEWLLAENKKIELGVLDLNVCEDSLDRNALDSAQNNEIIVKMVDTGSIRPSPIEGSSRVIDLNVCEDSLERSALDSAQNKEKIEKMGDTGSLWPSPSEGIVHCQIAGSTPCNSKPYKYDDLNRGEGISKREHVRKQLVFEEEQIAGKKIAPSTPGVAKPSSVSVIDITDSDDESNTAQFHFAYVASIGNKNQRTTNNNLKHIIRNQNDEDALEETFPLSITPKRKRASNVVQSDTESEDDDNVPISKIKRIRLQEKGPDASTSTIPDTSMLVDSVIGTSTPSRRRLVKLNGAKKKSSSHVGETKCSPGIPTDLDAGDDESEEGYSDSEDEGLGGFIVNTSDDSGDDDASSVSQDESDGIEDFDVILSNLQRKKDHKSEWEFEADMLSAFGKDPELCMKAVCALYRQQTCDEKISKAALHHNGRGFSKFDAHRGTAVAEFLTDGDPQSDLKKSVQDLQEYDPKGIEVCRKLAIHYSKQLFDIYKKKEDPLFLP